jgi:hypothetical protein
MFTGRIRAEAPKAGAGKVDLKKLSIRELAAGLKKP